MWRGWGKEEEERKEVDGCALISLGSVFGGSASFLSRFVHQPFSSLFHASHPLRRISMLYAFMNSPQFFCSTFGFPDGCEHAIALLSSWGFLISLETSPSPALLCARGRFQPRKGRQIDRLMGFERYKPGRCDGERSRSSSESRFKSKTSTFQL